MFPSHEEINTNYKNTILFMILETLLYSKR